MRWMRWSVTMGLGLAVLGGCQQESNLPIGYSSLDYRRDLDFDGVLDIHDKCPRSLETWNSFKDQDGCPDKAPKPPPEQLEVEGQIMFKGGGDVIAPQSYPILDKVVGILEKRPKMRLRIEGHTDNTGSQHANQRLSERRAISVKRYLVRKGISSRRTSAVGKGSSHPIASNDTPEGRALNRRVEFHIVKR